VLFATFFLKQTCDKDHINCETTPAETALVSGSITSATCVKSRLSITLAKILPPTDNSEIPRLLPQSTRSPLFLYIATLLASFHCWGTRQVLQILQMKACRLTWRSFPRTWTPQLVGDPRHRLGWIWDQRGLIELQSGWVYSPGKWWEAAREVYSEKEVSEGFFLFRRVLKCSANREEFRRAL